MNDIERQRPYGRIVASLQAASRDAADLGIDLFRAGKQREIIMADRLGHTLVRIPANPLVDAVDQAGRKYSYMAAHYGKRAQLFLSRRTPRGPQSRQDDVDDFIIAFFSARDACALLTMYRCSPDAIWQEIENQKTRKDQKRGGSETQLAYFSEALLITLSQPPANAPADGPAKAELLFRASELV